MAAMRSSAGVGITPPKVLGRAKPWSSVMMSSTFGAPFGGTTRGGHQGFDCSALRSILPSNLSGGGGSCLPLIGAVAHGEPIGQLGCCAAAGITPIASKALASAISLRRRFVADIVVNCIGSSFLQRCNCRVTLLLRSHPKRQAGSDSRLTLTLNG